MPMFLNNPKNFYWLIFSEFLLILFAAWLLDLFLLGEVLVFSFLYINCRYEPERIYTLLWGFQVQGLYLPFVIMGFRLLSGQSITAELVGLAIGELIYYGKETVPEKFGYDLLAAPEWFGTVVDWTVRAVYQLAARAGVRQERLDRREARPEVNRNAAFAGRGYRLG